MRNFKPTKGATEAIFVMIICIVLVAGTIYLLTRTKLDTVQNAQNTVMQSRGDDASTITSDDMMDMNVTPDAGATTKLTQRRTEPTDVKRWILLAGTSAPLYEFNKADYDEAIASNKLVVLYFYADWCPFCAVEFPVLKTVFNEMTRADVVGFRVHYNDQNTGPDERAIARQFGVGYQHTKVFLRNGVRTLKSPETWTKERYIAEINKL